MKSLSKSRHSSQARTRSTSVNKTGTIKLANKAHNASLISAKSTKSVGRQNKKGDANLQKQVDKKFKDLTMRLETDKEEVVNRLALLNQKVSKIQKE